MNLKCPKLKVQQNSSNFKDKLKIYIKYFNINKVKF